MRKIPKENKIKKAKIKNKMSKDQARMIAAMENYAFLQGRIQKNENRIIKLDNLVKKNISISVMPKEKPKNSEPYTCVYLDMVNKSGEEIESLKSKLAESDLNCQIDCDEVDRLKSELETEKRWKKLNWIDSQLVEKNVIVYNQKQIIEQVWEYLKSGTTFTWRKDLKEILKDSIKPKDSEREGLCHSYDTCANIRVKDEEIESLKSEQLSLRTIQSREAQSYRAEKIKLQNIIAQAMEVHKKFLNDDNDQDAIGCICKMAEMLNKYPPKKPKEERRCLLGREAESNERCYYHSKRIGGEPVFLCNSNCKNWVYKLPNEIEKAKDSKTVCKKCGSKNLEREYPAETNWIGWKCLDCKFRWMYDSLSHIDKKTMEAVEKEIVKDSKITYKSISPGIVIGIPSSNSEEITEETEGDCLLCHDEKLGYNRLEDEVESLNKSINGHIEQYDLDEKKIEELEKKLDIAQTAFLQVSKERDKLKESPSYKELFLSADEHITNLKKEVEELKQPEDLKPDNLMELLMALLWNHKETYPIIGHSERRLWIRFKNIVYTLLIKVGEIKEKDEDENFKAITEQAKKFMKNHQEEWEIGEEYIEMELILKGERLSEYFRNKEKEIKD